MNGALPDRSCKQVLLGTVLTPWLECIHAVATLCWCFESSALVTTSWPVYLVVQVELIDALYSKTHVHASLFPNHILWLVETSDLTLFPPPLKKKVIFVHGFPPPDGSACKFQWSFIHYSWRATRYFLTWIRCTWKEVTNCSKLSLSLVSLCIVVASYDLVIFDTMLECVKIDRVFRLFCLIVVKCVKIDMFCLIV